MTAPIHFLIVHGPLLLFGVSLLLGAGAAGVALQRSPIHRQRLSELAIVCTLAWVILACVPMRRLSLSASETGKLPEPTPADAARVELPQASNADQYSHDAALPNDTTARPLLAPVSESASRAEPSPHLPPSKPQMHSLDQQPFWPAAAAVVNVAGSFVCMLYLALGYVLLARLIRRCRAPEPAIADQFQAIARQYGARKARLMICPGGLRPMSCGLWRPTVIIDEHLERSASARLRQVLRHESAHLAQRDAWGNALFNLALPMLWAHPLYWWLRSRAFLARELVADERAAAFTARQTYAADLLSLARDCRSARPGPLAVVGMFHFTTDLKWRIHMLLQNSKPMPVRCSRRWRAVSVCLSAAALLTTGATLGLRPAHAKDQAPSTNSGQAATADQPGTGAAPSAPGNPSAEQAQADQALNPTPAANKQEIDDALKKKWETDYLPKVYTVNGQQVNLAEIQLQFDKDTANFAKEFQKGRSSPSGNQPGAAGQPASALAQIAQAGPTEGGKAQPTAAVEPATDQQGSAGSAAQLQEEHRNLQQRIAELRKQDDALLAKLKAASTTTAETAAAPVPALSNAAGAAPAPGGLTEMVNLASAYSDATAAVRMAETKLRAAEQAHQTGTDTAAALDIAKTEFANAQSKAEVMGTLVKTSLAQAQRELSRWDGLFKAGAASTQALETAKGRVEMLEVILRSGDELPRTLILCVLSKPIRGLQHNS